ncbi:hypothetical protein llap_3036 [Limosa lapponica baueri]|uniref:Uncharacterized protein n=1 Tax=Limosa lapponica baueri TaxID=1758121 RepID=A0A2I0UKV4_LIMLA|nr:hypothetical protein llap_3036 [Limosa lapponica baueri]
MMSDEILKSAFFNAGQYNSVDLLWETAGYFPIPATYQTREYKQSVMVSLHISSHHHKEAVSNSTPDDVVGYENAAPLNPKNSFGQNHSKVRFPSVWNNDCAPPFANSSEV